MDLIFSDESGQWNGSSLYVRAWIKIDEQEYIKVRKDIIFYKHMTRTKEIKWNNINNNIGKKHDPLIRDIFDNTFMVMITITKSSHSNAKAYNVVNSLTSHLSGLTSGQTTGGEEITHKVKDRIINGTKNILFFEYYERWHIKNALGSLTNNSSPYKLFIDNPQCQNKDWISIAGDCGIAKSDIAIERNSEDNEGIELADIIAGCCHKIMMDGTSDERTMDFYHNCIKNKMTDMSSREFPNPNLIFYPDWTEEDKSNYHLFRQ